MAVRIGPYLLADLQAIAADPAPYLLADTPLQLLMSDPDPTPQPEAVSPSLDGVVYPFPSNAAQRQVADALEKNRIVVVQGPPGNGKSLTIANLVAHFVAQGKSVLVASHKAQALTVVRDKLEETEQKFLFASLIGEGAQAKRGLQRQIADVKAFAGAANRSKLERQTGEVEQRRAETGERYRLLRQDYIDRAEADQQEAADQFEQTVGIPSLDARDPAIPENEREAVVAAFRALDEMTREHALVWTDLVGRTAGGADLEAGSRVLRELVRQQRARLSAATAPRVRALVEAWFPITDTRPRQIDSARAAVDQVRSALVAPLVSAPDSGRAEGGALAAAGPLHLDVSEGMAHLTEAFAAARRLAEHRDAVACDPKRRSQVLLHHAARNALVRRRAARKWMDEFAPGAVGLDDQTVADWAGFWDAWSRVLTLSDGLAGGLRTRLSEAFDPDAAQAVLARGHLALAWADAIGAVRTAAAMTHIPLDVEAALISADLASLDATLLEWAGALSALEADRSGNALKEDPAGTFLSDHVWELDALMDAGSYGPAAAAADRLDLYLAALPAIARRRELLAGPLADLPHSAAALERAAIDGAPAPAWLADIDAALSAHPALLRFVELGLSSTTRELAQELSELTSQVLQDARALLGGRIQQRILDGFRKPTFLSSLETFRKAIGASPKRFERFEELKHSPAFDVDVLTDVFPCWVMRPEDACRVFPLRAGIFDVVIFDEASQCNPDQVIPLFARAERALVVGDDNQLSNEDLRRTLATNANLALLRQAGLNALDPAGMFDQTKNSLLELASRRQQAQVLLNEHFRCRPEIIAFSNKAFYGGTLSVIRDREDDLGLGPALLVRHVIRDDGQPVAAAGKTNPQEAEALVADLLARIADPRYRGMSFGVLSLFREQIEHIAVLVERAIPEDERDRRRIICSTVDGFQGDERDVILYSWRYAAGDHPAVFAFTNGGAGEQRTNVALTRARHQSIHFVSLPVDQFPASARNVTEFLRHAVDPRAMLGEAEARIHREPGGRTRDTARMLLTEAGLQVSDDYVACGIAVDLLVRDPATGRRLAVLVDADRAEHRPVNVAERVDQHALLERAGWTVLRLTATSTLADRDATMRLVMDALGAAPSRIVDRSEEPAVDEIMISSTAAGEEAGGTVLPHAIAPEDRAGYHWDVPSVPQRMAAGEDVFMSGFEADLYELLARREDLSVVPQWPSRGKSIDVVITDTAGRRLAVEADGSQHHRDRAGNPVPEDLERQALLEEAGWCFARVAHRDFLTDPDGEIARLAEAISRCSPDPELAKLVWSAEGALQALDETLEQADSVMTVVAADSVSDSPAVRQAPPDAPAPPSRAPDGQSGETAAPSRVHADRSRPAAMPEAAPPYETPVSTGAAELIRANPSGAHFDDLALGRIVVMVTETVLQSDGVLDAELADRFAEVHGVQVPAQRRRALSRFAWTAKGKRYLTLDTDDQRWIPGDRAAAIDPAYADWTLSGVAARAVVLLVEEPDPFETLLGEVYAGARVPKLAASLVGTAINAAKQGHVR